MRKSLTKFERVKRRGDIKALFSSKWVKGENIRLYFLKNDLSYSRFLVTLTKKFGNSVERNRAKRIAREIFRNNKYRVILGYDIALALYKDIIDYKVLEERFIELIKKAGIGCEISE